MATNDLYAPMLLEIVRVDFSTNVKGGIDFKMRMPNT